MAVTQYIGARYVPIMADPIEWSSAKSYEPLTVVTYQGNSYTSRQAVPVGVEITNTDFWALTGNYNAQVEQYRQEVRTFDARITEAQETANDAADGIIQLNDDIADIDAILTGYGEGVTVKSDITQLQNAIDAVDEKVGTLPDGVADVVTYIDNTKDALDAEIDATNGIVANHTDTLEGFDTENPVKTYVDAQIADAKTDLLRNPTNMSEVRWNVASRHFRPEGYVTTQGFCIFEVGGITYWAQGDINTDSDGRVDIYRLDSHALVGSVSGNFGHIHGMSFVNNKLYLDASVAGSSANYVCINVTNPAAPVVLTGYTTIPTVNVVSRLCFISDTEVYFFRGSTGEVWLHSLTNGTDTLVATLDTSDMQEITMQNFFYDAESELFIIGTYHKSGVAIFDANTGSRINFIDVPTIVQHTQLHETEGAVTHDGKLYVNASEATYDLKLATLVVWDFTHGTAVLSKEMRPAESVNERYLRVSVTDSGDLVNPTQNNFRLASDAINLMHSQGESFSLHVHILGTSYSYPIILQDMYGTLECDEESCTLSAPVLIIGGNVTVLNGSYFNFAGSGYESCFLVINGVITIGSKPSHSGTFVNEISATYGAQLNVNGNAVFDSVILSRSVAFAKNSTNFSATIGSLVFISA